MMKKTLLSPYKIGSLSASYKQKKKHNRSAGVHVSKCVDSGVGEHAYKFYWTLHSKKIMQ